MTAARDLLADGNLTGAVAAQRGHVARWPTDPAARLFLAELLAVAGDLVAARDELRLVDSPDPAWREQWRRFVHVLKAEHRRTVRPQPGFLHLSDPPAHARYRRRLFNALAYEAAEGDALRWLDRADEAAPHLTGHWNGREFDGLRDADDRFAQVLEAFAGERYVWLPLDQVRRVRLDPPAGVLDVAFRPARVTLVGGRELAVVLPLTYPGSAAAGDAFALGQDVDFPDRGGPACGVGAKVLMLGDEEVAMADCRQVDFVV